MEEMKLKAEALQKSNLTAAQFFMLCLLMEKEGENFIRKTLDSLVQKRLVSLNPNVKGLDSYNISSIGSETVHTVVSDSYGSEVDEERLERLASAMRQIYPKGKKPGTTYYWSDGIKIIAKRLKSFFGKYGNKYTDQQILTATVRYVEDKEGDPTMRLLKYFIFKEGVGDSGEVEPSSDLLTYIENMSEEQESERQWGENLR